MAVTLEDPYGYWPIEWNFGDDAEDGRGGPAVDDPDVFVVVFTLIDEDDQAIELSLEKCVTALIDGAENPKTGKISIEHVRSASAVRDHLRKLADMIDAAIEHSA